MLLKRCQFEINLDPNNSCVIENRTLQTSGAQPSNTENSQTMLDHFLQAQTNKFVFYVQNRVHDSTMKMTKSYFNL